MTATHENPKLPTEADRLHEEGRALLRVATDLRAMIDAAPSDDPDATALRNDCVVVERIGRWLVSTNPIMAVNGVSSR